ncbi:7108_t:CDS:10 [Entrophospora sp. SA101]|nr:7108_t:CDS:10 [Entrophospora sp. SA101]
MQSFEGGRHGRKTFKKVPAYLTVIDIAGLVKGAFAGAGLGNNFLNHIRAVDAIFHVVSFSEDIIHVEGEIDPISRSTADKAKKEEFIHDDFEKGLISVEIMKLNDLKRMGQKMQAQIVNAALNKSHLWHHVRNGTEPTIENNLIWISDEMIVHPQNGKDPIDLLIDTVYPNPKPRSRDHQGKRVFIPRIPLTSTEDTGLPFVLKRKQFPVQPAFALTINKYPVQGKVRIYTKNIVYKEALRLQ